MKRASECLVARAITSKESVVTFDIVKTKKKKDRPRGDRVRSMEERARSTADERRRNQRWIPNEGVDLLARDVWSGQQHIDEEDLANDISKRENRTDDV